MNGLFSTDKFIDFHTHCISRKEATNILEIVSVHLGTKQDDGWFTVGKHPWWTNSLLTSEERQELIGLLSSEKCLAMGEIGLDKLKGAPIETQIEIFKDLLNIAVSVQKPVIIHCVKAFDTLIKIKRQYSQIENWCVHGFSRHSELAKQLIREGFYLSLMPVHKIHQNYIDLVQSLPKDRFFIETDNLQNTQIETLYLQVANIRGVSVNDLKQQLTKNAENFFAV